MTEQPERQSRVGEVLADKYRITRYLGEGGMGTVYEAQHAFVGRRFAAKILHDEFARGGEMLERFRREAWAAGALENENIASVIDFGHTADGVPYILMEFLLGEDLAKLLAREGQLPVPRVVNMIVQACRGLDAAHAAGVVHRDLKPENMFVCKRGDGGDLIKLLDFGIAKLSRASEGSIASVTRSGTTMGTPFYMPPEQARGAKDLDHRADIYALGVILYEALSGQRPHPGDSYNGILYHILTQPIAPLGDLRRGLDPDLVDIVHRALSFEPSDRPASAMELARALARHAGRQITPMTSQFELMAVTRTSPPVYPEGSSPVQTFTPVGAGRTVLLPTPEAPPPPPARVTRGTGRRFPRAQVAGVASAILIALVVTVWWVASRNNGPPTATVTSRDRSIRNSDKGDDSNLEVPVPSPPRPVPVSAIKSEPVRPDAGEESPPSVDVSDQRPARALDTSARQTPASAPAPKRHKRDRGEPAPAKRLVFDKNNPYR